MGIESDIPASHVRLLLKHGLLSIKRIYNQLTSATRSNPPIDYYYYCGLSWRIQPSLSHRVLRLKPIKTIGRVISVSIKRQRATYSRHDFIVAMRYKR